jgi:hypothetical protein
MLSAADDIDARAIVAALLDEVAVTAGVIHFA